MGVSEKEPSCTPARALVLDACGHVVAAGSKAHLELFELDRSRRLPTNVAVVSRSGGARWRAGWERFAAAIYSLVGHTSPGGRENIPLSKHRDSRLLARLMASCVRALPTPYWYRAARGQAPKNLSCE